MSVIDILYNQITALLDLMMNAGDGVDAKSIRETSEMCLSMMDELKVEIESKQDADEFDSCLSCLFQNRNADDLPCKYCKHNYTDYFKLKAGGENG